VNRLVDALLARPDVVSRAVERDVVTFDFVLDALGEAALTRSEKQTVFDDAGLLHDLNASYLPTITAPQWDGALRLTRGEAIASGWWTVMIPAVSGLVGVTIPQDSSPTDLVALFTGPVNSAGTLVYDPTRGCLVDAPAGEHCASPSLGICRPGFCGGCRSVLVLDKTGRGIKCRCQHQSR
jgi:hypothetical protein